MPAIRRGWIWFAAAIIFFSLIVGMQQHHMHAAQSGFGAYPDEPSHFLSAVLIHDYIRSGMHVRPLDYARQYYLRAPYFAVGYWPPAFYIAEGLWMLALGVSRSSAVLFIGLLTVVGCVMIYRFVAARNGIPMGVAAALFWLWIPSVRLSSGLVMTDIAVAVMCLATALSFARYMEQPGWRYALLTGLLAGTAILTKYTSLFMPVAMIAIVVVERRWDLFRRWETYLIAAACAILAGPWLWWTRGFADTGFATHTVERGLARVLAVATSVVQRDIGWPYSILALAGVGAAAINWRRLDVAQRLLLLHGTALFAFVAISPVDAETRYNIPAYIAFVCVIPAGLQFLGAALSINRAVVNWGFVAATLLFFEVGAARVPSLPRPVTREIAAFVTRLPQNPDSSVLVPTAFEGPTIAEFSTLESKRPGRILVRPVHLFAQVGWNGDGYRLTANSPEAVETLLDRSFVGIVILSSQAWPPPLRHEEVLRAAVEGNPANWRLIHRWDGEGSGQFEVFQRRLPFSASEPDALLFLNERFLARKSLP
jgi:hypothetical protein